MTTLMKGTHRMFDEITIDASATEVWEVLADFCAVHTWAPQVTRSHALDAPERGPGAARHCDIKGFGSIQEYVLDWQEGRGFTYRVTPIGPLGESINRWTVEPASAASSVVRVDFSYDTRYGPLGVLLNALMMRGKLRKGLGASLAALRRRVETGQLVRPRELALAA